MGAKASQITSLMIVYSTVDSDADRREHQSSASLAFVRGIHRGGIHRGPVNSPHKWPVTRKMFPFDDVIMVYITQNVEVPRCWPVTSDSLIWSTPNICLKIMLKNIFDPLLHFNPNIFSSNMVQITTLRNTKQRLTHTLPSRCLLVGGVIMPSH